LGFKGGTRLASYLVEFGNWGKSGSWGNFVTPTGDGLKDLWGVGYKHVVVYFRVSFFLEGGVKGTLNEVLCVTCVCCALESQLIFYVQVLFGEHLDTRSFILSADMRS